MSEQDEDGQERTPGPRADRTVMPPPVREAVSTVMKRLVDRGRWEIERAVSLSRHRLESRQLQRDRDHFWMRLGKEAYHLVEAGEVDHPGLRKAMERIDDLEARIADHEAALAEARKPEDLRD